MSSTSNTQQPPTSSANIQSQTASNANTDPGSGYAPIDSQLAGLVEAATQAASTDVSWASAAEVTAAAAERHPLENYNTEMHLGDDTFGDTHFGSGMGGDRHLRVPNEHAQSPGLSRTVSKKRKRNEDNLDPQLAAAGLSGSQQQYHSQQNQHGHPGVNMDIRPVPQQALPVERAPGVHSAAALFRQPSSNKKYTRPPMSKLFSSLELSPENFLHLQAAAKAYMLDNNHPERRDCVGQRGKGDTEMVKLRLWNCVKTFLDNEGNGERFFGENVVNENMGPRQFVWPRDSQKIISLVIPLLRRMVTNERQRQYAIETRKGGGNDERRRRQTNESFPELGGPRFSPEQQLQMHSERQNHRAESVSQSMPPPQINTQQTLTEACMPTEINLTDLFLDGYTVDWNEVARTYDMYNGTDLQLDHLWSLSGLQQPDWRGIVAAIDSHYYVVHNGHYECAPACENENINRIIHANSTANLNWRIGGVNNQPARDEFASSITRDVSRIIRENLAAREDAFPPPQTSTQHYSPRSPLYLRINVLKQSNRILPRIDLPANECSDVNTLKQIVMRRFPELIGSDNFEPSSQQARDVAAQWKTRVLLPDGLVEIQNDKDWTVALLSADSTEWMDGDLKVLIDLHQNQH
ncbi:hypothetical protein N7532_010495 [Penicillium argentinense]|uniref:Uncharacterized protein n=1 Tax=Penicillium argentinense TaxID=1131581 RepID=A0A9W9JXQ0_9EURO|nr:uncharacterized protein N7532_010495 [Penicillium argentinense]KAJ5085724.1 hypothetical protein N7532_010495 [Penicillium argentinense]